MFGMFKKKEDKEYDKCCEEVAKKLENEISTSAILPVEEKNETRLLYHFHLSNGRLIKALVSHDVIRQASETRSGALVFGHQEDEKVIEKVIFLDQVTHITLERK